MMTFGCSNDPPAEINNDVRRPWDVFTIIGPLHGKGFFPEICKIAIKSKRRAKSKRAYLIVDGPEKGGKKQKMAGIKDGKKRARGERAYGQPGRGRDLGFVLNRVGPGLSGI